MRERAPVVLERCDRLAEFSEQPGIITRPYGTPALREANDLVSGWMRAAGMSVRLDALGNLIGRYGGTAQKTLVLGSHLDTVRDAGRYDGVLGVMIALACVEELHERGERLPFAVEVTAFADEEGLRFGTTFLGSSVYAGAFDPRLLELEDAAGTSFREAVLGFGGDPDALERAGRDGGDLLGYCEVHIEQGPLLEEEGLPAGVVTAINGQSRLTASFTGEAGHAGTVPMHGRRDALCAAAEFVLALESAARGEPGEAVGTVGELSVRPGASNVIPGEARLSCDLRHPDDDARERLRDRLEEEGAQIAASRGCEFGWRVRQETPAVQTDRHLSALLARAAGEMGIEVRRLPSGAGHDAAQLAALTPVAMLFVRCEGGISHNPAESVAKEDVEVALAVMERFLRLASAAALGGSE